MSKETDETRFKSFVKSWQLQNLINDRTWSQFRSKARRIQTDGAAGRKVSEDVTDDDTDAGLHEDSRHLQALCLVVGHGLLQDQVVALPGHGHRRLKVHPIL